MPSISLKTPLVDLAAIKGSGLSPAVARKLAAAVAGFAGRVDPYDTNVEDLLCYFPARYEDRSNLLQIDKLYDGIEASVELFVRVSGAFQVGKNRGPKKPPLYIFELTGGDRERVRKPVVVMWFISGKTAKPVIEYYSKRFSRGVRLVAHGRWEWDGRRNTFVLKVNRPEELEILPNSEDDETFGLLSTVSDSKSASPAPSQDREDEELEKNEIRAEFATVHTARHVPVYRKLGPFQTKRLREILSFVVKELDVGSVDENLPSGLRERNGLINRADAITEIHFPPDSAKISEYESYRSNAHRRLIFEEFFWLSLSLQLIRGERRKESKGSVIEITDEMKRRIAELLPFRLTEAQRRVVRQIFADLTSDAPMNRLIQGDVGSGKTIVAFITMFAAIENGYQAALMAPTEILADQHYRNARSFFEKAGYQVGLLIGSMKATEKRRIQESIAKGEIQVIIGTHALIQDAVEFEDLGVAVIDEQHRFGVLQRAALKKLGTNPDVLVMTATPIPRSLAMTVYGDLDVSLIDELPPGRTPIKTVVVGEDKRAGVYRGIERELALGRQTYVVYPLIEESEKLDLKAATAMFEVLRDEVFPNRRVGLLHGKMKSDEKDAIMSAFVAGNIDILVSTTVIEVGVDVPNASTMVIEHAERFGLSQLHQLRGRVGRGSERSYCVLLTGDKKTAVAKDRLGIMEETNDGFKIAEKDLEIRGEGEILGTRQSGVRLLRIANIVRDIEILEAARYEAEQVIFSKSLDKETAKLVEIVRSDSKFRLATIG